MADWPGIGRLAWDWLIGTGLAQIGTDWQRFIDKFTLDWHQIGTRLVLDWLELAKKWIRLILDWCKEWPWIGI